MITFDATSEKFFAIVNGQRVESANKQYLKTKIAKLGGGMGQSQSAPAVDEMQEPVAPRFDINERFDFTAQLVDLVADGTQASVLITGEGGLGKTYTVMKTLAAAGFQDKLNVMGDSEEGTVVSGLKLYRVVKGYSTPKGLYRMLYENQNSIVVFDDCDSVFKDPDAVNLLKGALDSSEDRWISWNSSKLEEDLPRSFKFTGGVIFISNLAMGRIDQAIRSRSMCVDLGMTTDEKLDRMAAIMNEDEFMADVSMEMKADALDLIREHKDRVKEISMRTLISIIKIRATGKPQWAKLAEYVLMTTK